MTALPKIRPSTYADIEALPPHVVGEILFGALHTHPRPAPRHGLTAGELQFEITGPYGRGRGGPGGGFFWSSPNSILAPTSSRLTLRAGGANG